MTIQVAEVNKVLGSVGKMTEAGNTIIFSKTRSVITSDPDGSIAEAAIKNAKMDRTTELQKKNGVYTFDMWIPTSGEISGDNTGTDNYNEIGNISDFAWLEDEVL